MVEYNYDATTKDHIQSVECQIDYDEAKLMLMVQQSKLMMVRLVRM